MGYNTNISVVQRWKDHLLLIHKKLFEENLDFISIDTPSPETFFYRIQEAINAAEHHNIPKLGMLRRNIKVTKPKSGDRILIKKIEKPVPINTILDTPTTQFDVIEEIIKHRDSEINYELLLPNIPKDPDILNDILTYCTSVGYEMVEMDKGILVRRIVI